MSDNPIAEQQTGNESSRNSNDWQARGLRPHRNWEAINGRQTPSWAWQLVAVAGSWVWLEWWNGQEVDERLWAEPQIPTSGKA